MRRHREYDAGSRKYDFDDPPKRQSYEGRGGDHSPEMQEQMRAYNAATRRTQKAREESESRTGSMV